MKKLRFDPVGSGLLCSICVWPVFATMGIALPIISLLLAVVSGIIFYVKPGDTLEDFAEFFTPGNVISALVFLVGCSLFPPTNIACWGLVGLSYFYWPLLTLGSFGTGLILYGAIRVIKHVIIFAKKSRNNLAMV